MQVTYGQISSDGEGDIDENQKDALAAGRSHHDIIGSLPLELVVLLVEYLDEIDIVRSQRVSKRWYEIFSCETIIQNVLFRTLAVLGRETTNVAAVNAMTYFRWHHGLKSARPVKKVLLPWPDDDGLKPRVWKMMYCSRRLGYVYTLPGSSERRAALWDLETGNRLTQIDTDNMSLDAIRLSDRYLVLILSDGIDTVLEVWEIHRPLRLENRRKKRFSSRLSRLSVDKDKVFIFTDAVGSRLQPIKVWDLRSDQVRMVGTLSAKTSLWHADADEDMLVTFEFYWSTYRLEVQQNKWSLTDGELVDRRNFCLQQFYDESRLGLAKSVDGWRRSYGRKTVSQLIKDGYTTMHIMYDYAIDRLSLRWIDCDEPINFLIHADECGFLGPRIIYRWTHEHMGVAVLNTATGTATVHPNQLDMRQVNAYNLMGARPPFELRHQGTSEPMDRYARVFGDQEVFGVANEGGTYLQLWFFNPDFVPDLPDTEPVRPVENWNNHQLAISSSGPFDFDEFNGSFSQRISR